MESGTREYHQMAIAILAIATAALGFGLWTQDFDFILPKADSPSVANLYVLYGIHVVGPPIAVLLYFGTFISVGMILGRSASVTGKDLLRLPLAWLYWQMVVLALLFLAGFLSDLIAAQGNGQPLPM